MTLFFFSDLHLRGSTDPLYRNLLNILELETRAGDRVVFAGDIFDLFVGNKQIFKDRYSDFFHFLLAAPRKNIDIDYIEGNHDFSMQEIFSEQPRVHWHPDHVVLETPEGKRFYVAHGDLVNEADYGYLALRWAYRSSIFKSLIRLTPGKWIDKIGQAQSSLSRTLKAEVIDPSITNETQKLRKIYHAFAENKISQGYDYVVLGHCHDLDETEFQSEGRTGQYLNMGYPPIHRFYLRWRTGESKIQRIRFPD